MKLYAQHGFQPGKRISQALTDRLIDGVVYSAKDLAPAELSQTLAAQTKNSDRFFDPQYYASVIAGQPGARLGWLFGDEGYPYFHARRRPDLERETKVREDLEACLSFQAELPVTALIAPNILVRRALDSIEGGIAKQFIRNTATVAKRVAPGKPVYATLAVSAGALADRIELQTFLQEMTEIENPPDGFYLLIERPDQAVAPSLTEPDVLSRWMLVNHTLRVNGLKVMNGYTDLLAPYLGAAGATAVACGWWNTLKAFSMKKFEPAPDHIMRKPLPRYTSVSLLKSIRCTELHDLRDDLPGVLNNLGADRYFDRDEGSEPTESWQEALQNWEALRTMIARCSKSDASSSVAACKEALEGAEDLYARITDVGYTLRDRSSNAHIEAIGYELDAFSESAEI
jgi:hypothetical protein